MARRYTRSQLHNLDTETLMQMHKDMQPVEDNIAPPAAEEQQGLQQAIMRRTMERQQPTGMLDAPMEEPSAEPARPFIKPAEQVALDSTMATTQEKPRAEALVDAVAKAKMDEVRRKNHHEMYGIPMSGKMDPRIMSDQQAHRANLMGIWQGVKELGQEAQKIFYSTGEFLGIVEPGTRSALGTAIDAQRLEAEAEIPEEHRYQYRAGKFIGSEGLLLGVTAPLAAPVAMGGKLSSAVARIALAGAGGAAAGALTPTQSEVSHTAKIGTGAAVGAAAMTGLEALGVAGKGAAALWQLGNKALGTKLVKDEIIREAAQKTKEGTIRASKETGIPLDPAEATGSSSLAEARAKLGRTPSAKDKLDKYAKIRDEKTKTAITEFMNKVSAKEVPNNLEDSVDNWAADYLANQKKVALAKASPLYDTAYKVRVSPEVDARLMENPVINKTVLRNDDPDGIIAATLKEYPEESLGRWDAIKKLLDAKAVATNDRGAAKQFRLASKQIREEMDNLSPEYAQARKIAMDDLEDLRALEASTLGRLANMAETQKKRMVDILFDSTEPRPSVLGEVRDMMVNDRPDLYYSLVRRYIEKQLTKKSDVTLRTGNYGKAIQEALLGSPNKRRVLDVALYRNPEARKNALYLTRVFKAMDKAKAPARDFDPDITLTAKRALGDLLNKYTVGRMDEAVADVMVNPGWMDKLAKYRNMKPDSAFVQGKVAEIIEQALARQAAISVVGEGGN